MASNKRTIYLGLDYSEFSGGVTEINRKMGLLDAEFRRATQEAKNYGTETDQLALKQDYLTQKIALQNQKVEAAKKAYDEAMASNKASQKEIDELDKRLLNERTALEKLNGQLIETEKQTSGVEEANEKLNKSLKTVLGTITAVAAAWVKLTVDFAHTCDELLTLSAQTGMTTTEIQRLQYASELIDVEFNTMSSSVEKVKTNMGKARDGSKDLNEAFRKLHIRIKDGNGQLRDATDVFYDIIDALGKSRNETERDILAKELLGKSYTELKPLIEAGTDALKKYGDEAERTGKVMSEDQVVMGGKLSDTLYRLETTLTAIGTQLAEVLAPVIEGIASFLGEIDIKTLLVSSAIIGIIALIAKLVTTISMVTTVMAAQTGIQTVFNMTALKTVPIVLAIVTAIALLVWAISQLTGSTEDAKKNLHEIEGSVDKIGTGIQASATQTKNVGRKASGADFYQGGTTWVGEEGPELVDLPRGSKIYNAKKSAQMAGATTNYYTITIDAKNVQDFQRVVEMANSMQMATRRI